MKIVIIIINLFIFIFSFDESRAQDLVQTIKTTEGITYKLPSGWKQIDAQTLENYSKEMAAKMPNSHPIMPSDGYVPDNTESGIGYPNILVMYKALPKKTGGVTSSDLRKMAERKKTEMQSNINNQFKGNSLDATANIKDVTYDEQGQFVRLLEEANIPNIGTIYSIGVIFGTADGMFSIQFNSKLSEYNQYSNLFSKIISTIEKPEDSKAPIAKFIPPPPIEEPSANTKEEEDRKLDAKADWVGRTVIPLIIIAVYSYYKSKKKAKNTTMKGL